MSNVINLGPEFEDQYVARVADRVFDNLTARQRKRVEWKAKNKAAKAKNKATKAEAEACKVSGPAKTATVAELALIADDIRETEARNVKMAETTVANVIAIAARLGEARPHLKHGEWGPWLASEFKWSPRTSARYWSVYNLSKTVPDLDKLNISVSVLYLLAEMHASKRIGFDDARGTFAKIIVLAREQRVTIEMAGAIIHPMRFTSEIAAPTLTDIGFSKPVLTPREKAEKERRSQWIREKAIGRMVKTDLTTEFGMQAFKNSLAHLSRQSEEKFLTVLCEVMEDYIERKRHPSRFDGSNIHDGNPEFDLPDQWRRYETAMSAALGD